MKDKHEYMKNEEYPNYWHSHGFGDPMKSLRIGYLFETFSAPELEAGALAPVSLFSFLKRREGLGNPNTGRAPPRTSRRGREQTKEDEK